MALQEHGEVSGNGLPRRCEELEPVGTGTMGSTFYSWQFAAADLPAVLEHDWSQLGRRVFVNPERGKVTLMAPSGSHENTSALVGQLVFRAGERLSIQVVPVRGTTWRPPGSRRVEADESYYLGETALRCLDTHRMDRPELVDAFFDTNPPQLVVEVERTHDDAGKPAVYRDLGVAEMWRIDVRREAALSVEILALPDPGGVRTAGRSVVLPGLTPSVIGQALTMARREGAQVIPRVLAAAGIGRDGWQE